MTDVGTQEDLDRSGPVAGALVGTPARDSGLGWLESHAIDIDVSRETSMSPSGLGWPT